MKITMKKSLAVILSLVMCVSVLFGMSLSVFAADTNVVNYVYDGTKVYNWGERGETATFLSPMAIEFYSDNNVSLDALLALNGSSTESGVPSSALYKELNELMKDNHDYITGYDATKNLFKYTDCQNGGGKISSFYSGQQIGPSWDNNWNREHVWPNSKGDAAGNGENDLMMLRPTSTSENSSRGNKAYGTTTSTNYYNPNDEGEGAYDLRGDCARIILYQYVRWQCTNTGSKYNSNGIFGANGVIESKDVLLDWIEADPVDTWELGRNDAAESILGTRNVFVDYPELAFDLFNESVPTGYTTPSAGVSVEGTTGTGGNAGNTGGDAGNSGSSTTETTEVVFNLGDNGTASHYDGSSATSYTETVYNYTLTLSNGSSFYTKARDDKGNSAIKLGTSSKDGSFTMTAPDDVTAVIFNVAQYKANATVVTINGTQYTITTSSTSGAYTPITIDTTTNKSISFASAGSKHRCMIDSITYVIASSSSGEEESGETNFVDTSDIVVSGSANAFPTGTTVTATQLTSGTAFNTATSALADVANKFKAYDISAPSQPASALTLTLAIPSGYDTDFVFIAYIADNGDVELLDSSVNKADNTVSATIEHFSTYAVIEKALPTADDGGSSGGTTTEETVTISFATTAQRVSQNGDAQIWSNNGLTFTNNKAASSNAVVNNVNPIRVYANSSVTVEHATGKIKSITFAASGSSYVTPLQNSVKTISGATVTTSGNNVTATFSNPAEICTIAKITAQVRLSSVTATVLIPSGGSGVTITAQSNNTSYGSVELSGNYIIATPNEGYEVVGYEVVSGTATVTQNGNNFTVDTDADVTVQINFAPRTQYTVTFKEMGATTSTQTAYSGNSIKLPAITSDDYTVVGWVAAEIDGETTDKPTIYNAGSNYAVTGNVTFYALYSRTQAGGSGESTTFTKWTEAVTEGDYIIVGAYSSSTATPFGAMNTSKNNNKNRLDYTEITVTNDTITTEDSAIIWHIASSGDGYWTIYNEAAASYAAGNGTKNLAVLITSVTDYAKWDITGTTSHVFENVGNEKAGVNYTLRRNGTSGYACYAASTGTAPVLYKRTAAAMTTYYFTGASETPNYTVTANANDDTFGTVNVSGTTISATPNAGYTVAGYSIVSGTATVVREGNTFFVTPTSNVEITINFETLPTYTVTFIVNGEEIDSETTYSGGFIKLPEFSGELEEYTTFDGWAEKENETDATKIYAAKATFAVTKNVTLYAQFTVTAPPVVESDHYFVKVTENQTDWSGTYLIVYEAGSIAFNGAMADKLDVTSNGVGVTIADGKIAATDANIAISFVVEKIEGGYTIRSKSGLYFGSESDANSLLSSATKTYFNNFAIDADGNTVVTGEGGAILRYNATSGQDRFRFYKTGSYTAQKPIALYKLDVADISGAQVTVGADISMSYYVDITNIAGIDDGELAMRFTLANGGAPTTVALDKSKTIVKDSKTYYVFTFAGVAPQQMCDNIRAELLLNGTVVDLLGEYSVKQNAANLLGDSPSAELKQFVTDLLYYGAAAQTYTKYNTGNLATSGDIAALLGTPSTIEPSEDDKMTLTTSSDAPANGPRFRAASVWFDSTNKIIVKLVGVTANTQFFIDESLVELDYDAATDTYSFTTDAIEATRFKEVFEFYIYENGEFVQKLVYSINAYAYSKYQNSNNPNMATLALALYRVGKSAEAFAASL